MSSVSGVALSYTCFHAAGSARNFSQNDGFFSRASSGSGSGSGSGSTAGASAGVSPSATATSSGVPGVSSRGSGGGAPLNFGRSLRRIISSQSFSLNHSHGMFSDPALFPKPPVNKNRYSVGSSVPLYPKIVAASVNENSSLSFSNNDRQMFLYSEYVKKSMRLSRRSVNSDDFSACSIACVNRLTYHASEYWYIGPMSARSAMTKYRMEPRVAAALYVSRVSLMFFSVSSASMRRPLIIPEVILLLFSVSMRSTSSRMFPSDSFRSFKILSSKSLSCFLSFEMDTTSRSFASSRSGRSFLTTSPKS
mmetsp:Transcript_4927/g.17609  ORF Transcript_4927/g.17609 Transcript_4927/m.17609 type:complete len:307 (-) Transcript_4927:2260-3180(-)